MHSKIRFKSPTQYTAKFLDTFYILRSEPKLSHRQVLSSYSAPALNPQPRNFILTELHLFHAPAVFICNPPSAFSDSQVEGGVQQQVSPRHGVTHLDGEGCLLHLILGL